MDRDVRVTVLAAGVVQDSYVITWESNAVEHTRSVRFKGEEVGMIEVKVGRCICKLLECPVHGEINQEREEG